MDYDQLFLFIFILYGAEYRRYTIELSAKGHDLMCDRYSVFFPLASTRRVVPPRGT